MRAMNEPVEQPQIPAQAEPQGLTFWQVLSSTMAAAFGVQSSKNRKRDFTHGKPSQFILMGIGFTAVFVLIMVGIVSLENVREFTRLRQALGGRAPIRLQQLSLRTEPAVLH